MPERPTLAISLGDPFGIGPEVLVKALADPARRARARTLILGASAPLHAAADRAGIEPFWWRVRHDSPLASTAGLQDVVLLDYPEHEELLRPDTQPGATRAGGETSYRYVEDAIALARAPDSAPLRADAVVTAPISKHAWALAGHKQWPGHTELLAARFGAKRVAMMFDSPRLRVVLATAHIPLNALRDTLSIGRVFEPIVLGHEACRRLGIDAPRIAVCGLNPHAGENGLLGDEETRIIEPAITMARESGVDATGPHPADTVFHAALHGRYDLVVAMYHDQGLIPIKTLFRDEAVNVTIGLPKPRTSPDHGTAFDIAGRNAADPRSMAAAIDLAARLAGARPV